ncbi:MAG: hypothetical protein MHM6MM_000162 [Cercozoa sp. M6MM]
MTKVSESLKRLMTKPRIESPQRPISEEDSSDESEHDVDEQSPQVQEIVQRLNKRGARSSVVEGDKELSAYNLAHALRQIPWKVFFKSKSVLLIGGASAAVTLGINFLTIASVSCVNCNKQFEVGQLIALCVYTAITVPVSIWLSMAYAPTSVWTRFVLSVLLAIGRVGEKAVLIETFSFLTTPSEDTLGGIRFESDVLGVVFAITACAVCFGMCGASLHHTKEARNELDSCVERNNDRLKRNTAIFERRIRVLSRMQQAEMDIIGFCRPGFPHDFVFILMAHLLTPFRELIHDRHSRAQRMSVLRSQVSTRELLASAEADVEDVAREAHLWTPAQYMKKYLMSPVAREFVSDALVKIFSQENLAFWTHCEEWRRLMLTRRYRRAQALARLIFDHYLAPDASNAVNLDAKMTQELQSQMRASFSYDRTMAASAFDEAEYEILQLIVRNTIHSLPPEMRKILDMILSRIPRMISEETVIEDNSGR